MLKIDAIVFWCCVLLAFFWAGIEVGISEAKTHIATTCAVQPNETLLATHQARDGVVCIYNTGYARTGIKRRATL